MGQSESSPLLSSLKTLLKHRGISVRKSSLQRFIDDVFTFAPWFITTGSLSLPSWIKLGRDIDRARRTGLGMDPILVPVWETVRACLEAEAATGLGPTLALEQARDALRDAQSASSTDGSCRGRPSEPGASSDSSDSASEDGKGVGTNENPLIELETRPRPSAPPAPASVTRGPLRGGPGVSALDPRYGLPLVADSGNCHDSFSPPPEGNPEFPERWQEEGPLCLPPPPAYTAPQGRSLALGRGRFFWRWNPFNAISANQPTGMFPVLINPPGNNQYEAYDYKVLKELRQAVHQYGPNAPFTLNMVENLSALNHTPADIYQLARACLPPGRYIDWKAWFEELAEEQAAKNAAGRRGGWNADMLLGKGTHAHNQTGYPQEVYAQVFRCFVGAWKKLTGEGEAQASLTSIHQGPTEPFVDFVAKMQTAAERIFSDPGVAETVIKQMIFEQCNKECKVILAQNRGKSLTDWVRLCRDAGSPLTNAGLAAMLASSLHVDTGDSGGPVVRPKTCFGCGKPGHFKRECPGRAPNRRQNEPRVQSKLCGRCRKGPHRAEDCRSAFSAEGECLSGRPEQPSKNGRRGPPNTEGPRPAPLRSVRPPGPQDWTSVPPPDSY
ncbi:endogenous retrovirus group K member 10 Gag polyprotein-like [Tamandua tetradactyla]|uniref:endogenous retrovirus group K member 10 Gag polyprotein-like n=1 Tax=Tamandua tetradactyla TaxID=48850 RepID=UPI004053D9F2